MTTPLSRRPAVAPSPSSRGAATARRAPRARPTPLALLVILLAATRAGSAQVGEELVAELRAELAAERQARQALERRVAELEAGQARAAAEDDLEAQLRALTHDDVLLETSSQRTVVPSAYNPRIGVFVDATIEAGEAVEELGEDGDRFSLRETELDLRLPVAPWAEGVLVTTFEDAGGGEFETLIEEGYADVQVGGLLGNDSQVGARVGRFRPHFGHDNTLHTHDLLQTDRPLAVQELLGEEGIIGDGLEVTVPVSHRQGEDGLGRTSTLRLALVNGEMLSSEEGALGERAEGVTELSSDGQLGLARWSEFWELSQTSEGTSDLELGASLIENLNDAAIETEDGGTIEPRVWGLDATWRLRKEAGVGSWLVRAESIMSDYDFKGVGGDFPEGDQDREGYWVTAQRQVSPSVYAGLRLGKTDMLASSDSISDITPYVSWYPDEFFRVRLQLQHLDQDVASGPDVDDVTRGFLQFTWNFGAHQPHPYWVNR